MVSDSNQSESSLRRIRRCTWPLLYLGLFANAQAGSPKVESDSSLEQLPVGTVVSANEFARFQRPSESPDGEWVAYCVTATTSKSTRVRTLSGDYAKTGINALVEYGDIWLTNIKTNETRSITGSIGTNWSPVWSPDGRHLAFYSDRPGSGVRGQTKLWMWDRATDKLQQISDVPIRSYWEAVWLPTSDRVLTTTLPQSDSSLASDDAAPTSVSLQTGNHGSLSTVKVYRSAGATTENDPSLDKSNGFQNLARSPVDISIISISDGAIQRVVQAPDVWRYAVSPDGSHIVTSVAKRYASRGGYAVLFDLIDYNLSSGSSVDAATDVLLAPFQEHVSWSPNSTQFSYRTSGPDANGSIYVVDALKKESRLVAGVLPGSTASKGLPLWDSSGRDLYFVNGEVLWRTSATKGGPKKIGQLAGSKLSLIARSGNQIWSTSKGTLMLRADDPATKQSSWYRASDEKYGFEKLLAEDKHYVGSPQVSHDARHTIYVAEDAQNEPNLWFANANLSERRRLTQIDPVFKKYRMGQSQLIDWRDIDGHRLQGALLLPAGYDKNMRYPLLVEIYGGKTSSDFLNLFGADYLINGQLFATRGYVVLHPDAPQKEGTPMIDLMKTIMPGVEKVVDLGIADPDRIGLMGHSYGGYSVLSLVVQSTRFKAAVTIDGIADIIGLYGQMSSDGTAYGQASPEHGQFLLGGTLWSHRDRYVENSPVFYLDRVKTPIMIMHGSEDSGASAFHADEVFVDLRRLGKEVTYAKYMGEDHVPTSWSFENQIDFLSRIIEWFDMHLKH